MWQGHLGGRVIWEPGNHDIFSKPGTSIENFENRVFEKASAFREG